MTTELLYDIKDYIKQVENLAETYHQGTISKSKEKKALEVLYDMENMPRRPKPMDPHAT